MSQEGLTKRGGGGTTPAVFWPYRPREGFPSVPRWLMIVLLIVAAILYVLIVNHFAAPHPEEWQHLVTAGGVVGARCERPIVPGEPWDLGHDDYDRSVYPARSIAPVTEPPPVTAGFRVGGDALYLLV
jgi:hypothetical protein